MLLTTSSMWYSDMARLTLMGVESFRTGRVVMSYPCRIIFLTLYSFDRSTLDLFATFPWAMMSPGSMQDQERSFVLYDDIAMYMTVYVFPCIF